MCPCEPLCGGTSTLSLKFTSMQTHLCPKLHSISLRMPCTMTPGMRKWQEGKPLDLRPREYLVPFLTAHCSCPLFLHLSCFPENAHNVMERFCFYPFHLKHHYGAFGQLPLIFTVVICLLVPLMYSFSVFFFFFLSDYLLICFKYFYS